MFRKRRISSVLAVLAIALIAGLAPAYAHPARVSAPVGTTPSGVPLYFIDFDIGTTVVRSGATHQTNSPTTPPYVELPNSGYPLTLVNFTVPPNYADLGDFVVRVTFSSVDGPCFFILQQYFVGYGPGHSAALFDGYWNGAVTPGSEAIIQVPVSYSTHELEIRLQPNPGFPTYPGDAMTLSLIRDSADINDTCPNNVLLRSISLTYEGVLIFSDNFGAGSTELWRTP